MAHIVFKCNKEDYLSFLWYICIHTHTNNIHIMSSFCLLMCHMYSHVNAWVDPIEIWAASEFSLWQHTHMYTYSQFPQEVRVQRLSITLRPNTHTHMHIQTRLRFQTTYVQLLCYVSAASVAAFRLPSPPSLTTSVAHASPSSSSSPVPSSRPCLSVCVYMCMCMYTAHHHIPQALLSHHLVIVCQPACVWIWVYILRITTLWYHHCALVC